MLMCTVCLHSTACMTAAPVTKVRNACVLQCLHMYMHVLKQESTFITGDLPPVVSKTRDALARVWCPILNYGTVN